MSREDRAYSLIVGGMLAAKAAMMAKAALAAKTAVAVAAANKAAIAAGAGGLAVGAAIGSNRAVRKATQNQKYNLTRAALKLAKNAVKETRETIIASKLAKRAVTKKDLHPHEKKFLKDQSKDVAKLVPIAGLTAVPLPFTELPYIAAGKAINKVSKGRFNILPGKQRIPVRYRDHNKFEKVNNWLDKKTKEVNSAKRKLNG